VDAFLNIEHLDYNVKYITKVKNYLTLTNMITKLVMYVDYAVKSNRTSNNKSILIALEWLCKMLEKTKCNKSMGKMKKKKWKKR